MGGTRATSSRLFGQVELSWAPGLVCFTVTDQEARSASQPSQNVDGGGGKRPCSADGVLRLSNYILDKYMLLAIGKLFSALSH